MAGPDSSHGVSRVVHHKDFYLRGGDMTVLVENHLYRIHSYFFERESLFFRNKLNKSNNGEDHSLPEHSPYVTLEDVKSEDFARFLWVFYNPKYSVYDAPLETWLSILQLANRWTFDNVKELSVRELEKITIEPVEKIAIYHDNGISRLYLIPSYVSVCKRDKSLSFSEGMKLGMETVLRIAEARERLRLQASESGIRTPTFEDFEDGEVEVLIREIFQLGPRPTSPTHAAPAANGANGSANVIKLNAAPAGNHPKANGASPAPRANGGSAADPKRSSVDSMPHINTVLSPQAPLTGTPKTATPRTGTPTTGTQNKQEPAPTATTQATSTPQTPPPPPPEADKPKDNKETANQAQNSPSTTRSQKPGGVGEPSSSVDSSSSQACDVSISKPDVLSSEHSNHVTAESNDNMNNGEKFDLLQDNDASSVLSDTDGPAGRGAGKTNGKNKTRGKGRGKR